MNYLTYLNIINFKSINNLELNELSDINIIVGENNIGKTSILEAISLLQSKNSLKTILKHISRRENSYLSKFELFLEMFPKEQNDIKYININSTIKNTNRDLIIKGKVNPLTNCNFEGEIILTSNQKHFIKRNFNLVKDKDINENSSYDIIRIMYLTPYDHVEDGLINKTIEHISDIEKNKIIDLLKKFDENILDFKLNVVDKSKNLITTYIDHKKYGFMPMFSFGDSIKKILTLASGIINSKDGILLVDEIETSIHKKMLDDVFKWLVEFSKEYNVQIICTTHSLEVIDSMIINLENDINMLSCFRIEKHDDEIFCNKFSGDKLKNIRTFLGQDVR